MSEDYKHSTDEIIELLEYYAKQEAIKGDYQKAGVMSIAADRLRELDDDLDRLSGDYEDMINL